MKKRGNESKGREGGDRPGAIACPSMINQPRLKPTPSPCPPQKQSFSTCDCIQTIKIKQPNAGLAGWTETSQQHPQKPRWPGQPSSCSWLGPWTDLAHMCFPRRGKFCSWGCARGGGFPLALIPTTAKVSCLGSH